MTEQRLLRPVNAVFNCQDVKRRMHEILHAHLHDRTYDWNRCSALTSDLSGLIKDALKTFGYSRYKFIVQVLLSEERDESLQLACRAYWDAERDRFAQSIYINPRLICVATTFAVFYD